ncbi:TetR/AcrR family transcriptional regulator [Gracilibacillus caseinilyticus]|uniref:TetR/AcrR family transcriptional regulator n=1 Tax=Gracilibacillus caseinilyticus TaxID=2932256 RepID=A0ABY4EW21_9BACI|nr:TetR/AcrR family transcriptional regulator [Gracilibacillus caseinilyticus]UOQ48608.1 TetR/AcrR family transcriptional regulator [Gracilibacillus caseinilyticus]
MNDTRKKIIDAAHSLFVKKGFAASSVQDILDKAEISKGTFYNHFHSKNDCLLAILSFVEEQIDTERQKIAIGKEKDNEEVFIEQVAMKMTMNREHNMMTVFQTVSISEDEQLKAYMHRAHAKELKWLAQRIADIYPAKGSHYTMDHAIMLLGSIHSFQFVAKLGSGQTPSIEKVIRYVLRRIKSMLDDQIKTQETFFQRHWLDHDFTNEKDQQQTLFQQLKQLDTDLQSNGNETKLAYVQFLINELQAEEPKYFLIESVCQSMLQAFTDSSLEHEIQQVVHLIHKLHL